MHCRRIQQRLAQLPTREIPEGELREHLSGCPVCTSAHIRFREIMETVERDRIHEVNPWFLTRLEARLESESTVNIPVVIRLNPILLSLMLLIPLVMGIWLGYNTFHKDERLEQDHELIAEVNNILSTPGYGVEIWYLNEE
jgi:hypothetical protein